MRSIGGIKALVVPCIQSQRYNYHKNKYKTRLNKQWELSKRDVSVYMWSVLFFCAVVLVYLQSCRVADGLEVDIMCRDPFVYQTFPHHRHMAQL
jgi:hypothetical protein